MTYEDFEDKVHSLDGAAIQVLNGRFPDFDDFFYLSPDNSPEMAVVYDRLAEMLGCAAAE